MAVEIEKVYSTTLDVDGKSASLTDRWDEERGILVLRGLEAGPGIIIQSVDEDNGIWPTKQRKIKISTTTASGIGEVNTASNLGTGVGLFAHKTGPDLKFKSLVAGNGINLVTGPNSITIDSTGIAGASNIGTGIGVFAQKSGYNLEFRNIVGTGAISVYQNGGDIVVNTTAESNDGTNLGTGGAGAVEVYAGKTDTRLQFKRLVAGPNISLTQDGQSITITAAATGEVNIGENLTSSGATIYKDKTGSVLNFRTLVAGSNVTLTEGATSVMIDARSDVVGVTTLGSGMPLEEGLSGDRRIQMKSLRAGDNIKLTNNGGEILIEAINVGEVNTAVSRGTRADDGVGIVGEKDGTALTFKRILAGANVVIDGSDPNHILISSEAAGMVHLEDDTTPLLGGDLDVNGNAITSSHNGDIHISPNGSGHIVLDGMAWPTSDGLAGQVLTTGADGYLHWATVAGGVGGSGETNHGINIGSGVAIYNGMAGTDLQFRTVAGASNKLTVVNNSGTVEFDIDQTKLDKNALGGGPLSLANGGLGVDVTTNQSAARSNLGLGSMAIQNVNAVSISGGSINGVVIGGTIAGAATFTNLTASGSITLNGMQFPSTDGAAGNFLATDGSGHLVWTSAPAGGTGSGETNDGSNLGSGTGVYAGKTGTTLGFKSLVAGSNVTITNDSSTITISAVGGAGGSSNFLGLTDAPHTFSGAANKVVAVNSVENALVFTSLATVATTGSYTDLTNRPALSAVATSGAYADLSGKPVLSTVATSGAYADLTGKPVLSNVATSGSYTDLTNKPSIPTNLASLTDVNVSGVNNGFVLAWDSSTSKWVAKADAVGAGGSSSFMGLTDVPASYTGAANKAVTVNSTATGLSFTTLTTVATTGSYNDLTNKPTIPAAQVNADWNASSGVAQILNKPSLSTVATSGSYADLTNTPTIPANLGDLANVNVPANPTNGFVLAWDSSTSKWVAKADATGAGGSTSFTGLTDAPASYTGSANKAVTVNSTATGLSFTTLSTVAITGSYSDLSGKPTIPTTLSGLTDVNLGTPSNNYVLTFNSTSGKWVASAPAAGTITAAANIGTAGVGVYDSLSGTTLQYRNISATDAKVSVSLDAANKQINIGINESSLTLGNLGGTLGVAKGGTGATTFTSNGLLVGNGTGAVSTVSAPTTSGTYLQWNGSAFTWATVASGTTDTASNVGANGVGVFKQKTGSNFEFKNINAASTKLSVVNNTTNNTIDIDVSESALSLNNIGGTLNVSKGGTGATTFATNGIVIGNGTGALTTIAAPSAADRYLHWNGTAFEWIAVSGNPSSVSNFVQLGDVPSSYNGAANKAVTVNSSANGLTFTTLATVATSGSYADLSNKPTIPTNLDSLTDVVVTSAATGQVIRYNGSNFVNAQLAYSDISGTPTLATVATSGSYTDLSNKPTIPTALSGLTDVNLGTPSNNYVLTYNSGTGKWVAAAAQGGGSGTITSGTNVGTTGAVGVFKGVNGTALEFKSVAPGSNKISVTDDTANNQVDIDVVEASLTLSNLGGTLSVAKGGTGATDAATARTNLGLGTIATQAASAVAITGGTINGTTIGTTTAAAGKFTTLEASGAITINTQAYNWTSSAGAAGTVLTNDGSGNLSWQAVSGGGTSTGMTRYEVSWTYSTTVPGSFVVPSGWTAVYDSGTSSVIITIPSGLGKTLVGGAYWGQGSVGGTRWSMRSPAAISKLEQDGNTVYVTTATSPTNFGTVNNGQVKVELFMV